MQKSKTLGTLPDPYASLQLFSDLSQHTLQRCRQLNTITKALRNHHIHYQWVELAKLLITYNGSKHSVSFLQDGLRLLSDWIIIPANSTTKAPMDHGGCIEQPAALLLKCNTQVRSRH